MGCMTSSGAQAEPALTLRQAVELALKNSPAVQANAGRFAEAQAEKEIAASGLLPKISAGAYLNRLNSDRLGPGGAPSTASPMFAQESFGGLTGRQLLIDGGKTSGAAQVALHGLKAEEFGFAATRSETVYRVGQEFFRALAARETTAVFEKSVERQTGFEALTAEFFRAGKSTRLDVLKAQAAKLDAERNLANARESEKIARVLLAQVIGIENAPALLDGKLPENFVPPVREEDLLKQVLENSPDMKRAAYQVQQAEGSLHSSRGARFPELALQGSYGYRDRDIGGSAPEWVAGINASWTLFDGGALSAQVAKSQARLARATEAKRALELELRSQLQDALRAWRNAVADAHAGASLTEFGRESVTAAEVLYRAGKATALDVLTAQADLVKAEGAQIQAATDYAVACLHVLRLIGNSLEMELNQ